MNSKAAKNRSFMDTLVALFKNVWLKRGGNDNFPGTG